MKGLLGNWDFSPLLACELGSTAPLHNDKSKASLKALTANLHLHQGPLQAMGFLLADSQHAPPSCHRLIPGRGEAPGSNIIIISMITTIVSTLLPFLSYSYVPQTHETPGCRETSTRPGH